MSLRIFTLFASLEAWIATVCRDHPFWIAELLLALALAYRSAWRIQVQKARQGYLQWQVKRFAIALVIFAGIYLTLTGSHTGPGRALVLAVGAALISALLVRPPQRARYIPAEVRKAVLRRDLGHERRYDSRIHAIDHRVPYSKGGENTVGNLRVLGRVENARKHDRMPTRRDFQKRRGRRVVFRPSSFFWLALEGIVSVWAFWEVLVHVH